MNQEYSPLKPVACNVAGGPCEPREETPREKLQYQKQMLEGRLERVNSALAALDAHPDIEKVMTLVGNAIRY